MKNIVHNKLKTWLEIYAVVEVEDEAFENSKMFIGWLFVLDEVIGRGVVGTGRGDAVNKVNHNSIFTW